MGRDMGRTMMPSCAPVSTRLLSSRPMNSSSENIPSGLGIDLVDVNRFRESLEKGGEKFRNRIFTPAERDSCEARKDPTPHYAARFAAKEAAMKALGTGWSGGIAFTDFEIHSEGSGPPALQVAGKAAKVATEHGIEAWTLSLTHTDHTAGAVVLAIFRTAQPPPSP